MLRLIKSIKLITLFWFEEFDTVFEDTSAP